MQIKKLGAGRKKVKDKNSQESDKRKNRNADYADDADFEKYVFERCGEFMTSGPFGHLPLAGENG